MPDPKDSTAGPPSGDPSPPLDSGRVLAVRWQIRGLASEEPAARLYDALDSDSGTAVTVWAPRQHLARDGAWRGKFLEEARRAIHTSHANLAKILEVGESSDAAPVLYAVLEEVSGRRWRDFLRQGDASLTVREVLDLAARLAAAIDAAHMANLLHGRLRPDSLRCSGGGPPRVFGFGLLNAPVTGSGLHSTLIERVPLDPQYAAPEQWAAAFAKPDDPDCPIVGKEADIYAFAVMVFEILAGGMPFDARSDVEWALAHRRLQPLPATHRNPNLPTELDPVFERALSKDPRERRPSAGTFLRDVTAALTELHDSPFSALFAPLQSGPGGARSRSGISRLPEPAARPASAALPRRSRRGRGPWFYGALVTCVIVAAAALTYKGMPAEQKLALSLGFEEFRATLLPGSLEPVTVEWSDAFLSPTRREPIEGWIRFPEGSSAEIGAGDLTVEGGSLVDLVKEGSLMGWRFRIAPNGPAGTPRRVDGITVRVASIPMGGASPRRTAPAASEPMTFDCSPPRATLAPLSPALSRNRAALVGDDPSGPSLPVISERKVRLRASFDELVDNLTAMDFVVEGGRIIQPVPAAASPDSSGGVEYEVVVEAEEIPPGAENRQVVVRLGHVTDLAGNMLPNPPPVVRWAFDNRNPEVRISSAEIPAEAPAPRTRRAVLAISIEVSEPVTRNLEQRDLKLDNPASRIEQWRMEVPGRSYSAMIVTEAPGIHGLSIPPGILSDMAGNVNQAAPSFTWKYAPAAAR